MSARKTLLVRFTVLATMVMVLSSCGLVPFRTNAVPKTDSDGDSVMDGDDKCSTTLAGSPVDADGCSLFKGTVEGVEFASGGHQLNGDARAALEKLVTLMNTYPEIVLELGGHTDNRGSARDNLALSKLRVMSVAKFLVTNGVNGDRLKPFGFGEARPVMSNTTAEGRAKNRRIEINIVE